MTDPSSNNGTARAEQMLRLTERLAGQIGLELSALVAQNPEALNDTLEETRQLTNLYRYETSRIQTDPSLLSGITPDQKRRLREATLSLRKVSEQHERAITACKAITEGLIGAIAQQAARHQQGNLPYGPSARLQPLARQSLNLGKIA